MYQAAIARGKTISLTYVKLLALGPGQVGKSTFLYRLLGLMKGNIENTPKEAQPQSSTGQSKLREVCIKYNNTVVAAAPDLSWELCGLQSLVEGLMWLLSNQTQDEDHQSTGIIASSPNINRDKSSLVFKEASISDKTESTESNMSQQQQTASSVNAIENEANTFSGPEPSTDPRMVSPTPPIIPSFITDLINKTISEYETLRLEHKHSPDVTKLHMLLNIANIGGQPAFLEMFPSLTIGPALYLLFTKLINDNGHVLSIDDHSKLQCVQYRTKDDIEPQDCQNYTYTSQEVIFCALSSIACFGLSDKEVERYITKESEAKKTSSLAMLFGTFADKIDTSEEGNKTLFETESSLRSQLSFCLKTFASNQETYKVSIEDCIELGKHFKLNREEVKVALKFLHKYIGLVMYFPNDENLQNLVVCNPQVMFSSISELTFSVYDSSSRKVQHIDESSKQKEFEDKEIFNPLEVKYPKESSKMMSIHDLVRLLVHLNIAAKITTSIDDTKHTLASEHTQSEVSPETKRESNNYFFPAILKTADIPSLVSDVRATADETLPEPLCIRFDTGYMPMGFTCANAQLT